MCELVSLYTCIHLWRHCHNQDNLTSKCFVQKVPYDSLCNPTFSSLQKHPTIVFHHVHKIDMNCLEIYLYWSYTICSLSLCYLASSLNIVILRGLYISCLRYNKSIIINVICQNILWISSWRMSLMKSSYIYIFFHLWSCLCKPLFLNNLLTFWTSVFLLVLGNTCFLEVMITNP